MSEIKTHSALLRRFFEGEALSEEQFQLILGELAELEPAETPWAKPAAEAASPATRRDQDLKGDLFERARALAVERRSAFESEKLGAPGLYSEVMSAPAEQRLAFLEEDPGLRTRAVAELLLREARELWLRDLEAARRLIEISLSIASQLDEDLYGREPLHDLKARIWATLGNLRRLDNDVHGAGMAFRQAEDELTAGTGDLLARARVLGFKSSFLLDKRLLREAHAALEEEVALYSQLNEQGLAGRALVKMSLVHHRMDEPEQAIEILQQALPRLDTEGEPRLGLVARHNLILYLLYAGRDEEAAATLEESRGLYLSFPDAPTQLQLRWLEGRIANSRGDLEEAEKAFAETRDSYVDREAPYAAALVSLDLAGVYVQQHRTGDLKNLAREMYEVFSASDVRREALASVLLFQQAANLEKVTLALVRELAEKLDSLQTAPREKPS